jgi:predicted nucleic acid-binding protein
MTTVFLDASPLGLLTAPLRRTDAQSCAAWLATILSANWRAVIPEIADYEVRRELLRAGKTSSIARLDALALRIEYAPLTTAVMRKAAEFWSQARQSGLPTASDESLDVDVILAAQAATFGATEIVVATTNVRHLSRFVPAKAWQSIVP